MEKTEIIWNSKFELEIQLENNMALNYIPNNMFMFKPPLIPVSANEDFSFDDMKADLMVRLDDKGNVENEIYEQFIDKYFSILLYYPNKNCLNWTYRKCKIDTIEYDEFYNKSKNDRPYNVILHLNIQQAVFHGNNKELVFGDIEEDDDTVEMIDGIKV